nr:MAG TPA: hypothetical protein [Caudoviricetes sp.]
MGFLRRAFNKVRSWFADKEQTVRSAVNHVDRTINNYVDRGTSYVRDAFRQRVVNPIEKLQKENREKWGNPFSRSFNKKADPNYLKQQQIMRPQADREKEKKQREEARKKLESTKAFKDAMKTPMKADLPLGETPISVFNKAQKAKLNEVIKVDGKAIKREQLLKDRQALKSGIADKKAVERIKLANAKEHPNASYISNKAIEGIPGIKGLEKLAGDDGKAAKIARKNSSALAKPVGLAAELGMGALSFGAAEEPAKAVFKKVAPNLVNGARLKVGTKLANSRFVKNAARKELMSVGEKVTEESLKKAAMKRGLYLADKLGADAAINSTAGAIDDVSQAYADSDNAKEFKKNLATNAALNWGLGGVVTLGGDVVKGLHAGKKLKELDRLGKLAEQHISDTEVESVLEKIGKNNAKKVEKQLAESVDGLGEKIAKKVEKNEPKISVLRRENEGKGIITPLKNEDINVPSEAKHDVSDLIRKEGDVAPSLKRNPETYASLDESVPFDAPTRKTKAVTNEPTIKADGTEDERAVLEKINARIKEEHNNIQSIKDMNEKVNAFNEFHAKLDKSKAVQEEAQRIAQSGDSDGAYRHIVENSPFSEFKKVADDVDVNIKPHADVDNSVERVDNIMDDVPKSDVRVDDIHAKVSTEPKAKIEADFNKEVNIPNFSDEELERLTRDYDENLSRLSGEEMRRNVKDIKATRTKDKFTSEALASELNRPQSAYSRELLEDARNKGLADYKVSHAKVEYGKAVNRVQENTNEVYHSLIKKYRDERSGYVVDDLADALVLQQHLEKIGMHQEASNVTLVLVDMMDKWGKFGAVAKYLKWVTPEGRKQIAERRLKNIAADSGMEVESLVSRIPNYEQRVERFANEENDLLARKQLGSICLSATKFTDFTAGQTLRNIRMFMMLSNPKTDIVNIVSNAVNTTALFVKDDFQYFVEGLMHKAGLIDERKTGFVRIDEVPKFMNAVKTYGDDVDKFIKADVEEIINAEAKYADGTKITDGDLGWKEYIKGTGDMRGGMQKVGRAVQVANEMRGRTLNWGDKVFATFAYKKQFYGYLKLHNFDKVSKAEQEQLIQKARVYAADSAKETTYREASKLADWLNNATNEGVKDGASFGKRILGLAVTIEQPFIKTPINVTKQMVNYTPIGVVNGVARFAHARNQYAKAYDKILREYGYKVGEKIPADVEKKIKAFATREVTPLYTEAANKFCRGMTGSTAFLAGFKMQGYDPDLSDGFSVITDSGADEQESDYFKRLGTQDYSIVHKKGDKTTSTKLNLSLPISASFFVGAKVRQALYGDKTEDGMSMFDGLDRFIGVVGACLEPVFSSSCLTGVTSTFNDIKQNKDLNPFVAAVMSMTKNYANQYIPSGLRAIAKATAPYDFDYQGTSNTTGGNSWEFWANGIMGSIPIANRRLAPRVDVNGNIVGEVKNGKDRAWRIFDAFFNPFPTTDVKVDDVAKENVRLYRQQKALDLAAGVNPENSRAGDILPKNLTKNEINISRALGKENAIRMKLDKFERAEYNRTRAKDGKEVVEQLLDSRYFNRQGALKNHNVPSYSMSDKFNLKELSGAKSTNDAMKWLAKQPAYIHASDSDKYEMRKTVYTKFNTKNSQKNVYVNVKGKSADDWAYTQLSSKMRGLVDSGVITKKQAADFVAGTKSDKRMNSANPRYNGEHYSRPYWRDMNAYLASRSDLTEEQKRELFDANNSNKKYHYGGGGSYGKSHKRYGKRGSGGFRRSGGKSHKVKSPIKPSKFKATKQSYGKVANSSVLSRGTKVSLDSVVPKAPLPKKKGE